MIQAEFDRNYVAPWGLSNPRVGYVLEGQPPRESKVVFEHYDDGPGREFVIVKFGKGDLRAFVPGDPKTVLGPMPTDAKPGRSYR